MISSGHNSNMAHQDHISTSSDEDIGSIEDQEQHNNDGTATNRKLEKQTTASSSLSAVESRAQSVVSRIRSREPGQNTPFTHPLSHTKTSSDVIVDFDGPDDPYRPLNWGFTKKAFTTVLYGLTTMGMCFFELQINGSNERCRCYLGKFNVRLYLSYLLLGIILT